MAQRGNQRGLVLPRRATSPFHRRSTSDDDVDLTVSPGPSQDHTSRILSHKRGAGGNATVIAGPAVSAECKSRAALGLKDGYSVCKVKLPYHTRICKKTPTASPRMSSGTTVEGFKATDA